MPHHPLRRHGRARRCVPVSLPKRRTDGRLRPTDLCFQTLPTTDDGPPNQITTHPPTHPPLLTGLVGYLKAGSLPSLYAGLGLGGTLGLLGYGELNEYKKTGAVTRKWTLLSLIIVRFELGGWSIVGPHGQARADLTHALCTYMHTHTYE